MAFVTVFQQNRPDFPLEKVFHRSGECHRREKWQEYKNQKLAHGKSAG
jgi:hypothetical protein